MWIRFIFLFTLFISTPLWAQGNVSMVLADTDSGYIFARENEYKPLPPASLTKLMTLYLTFASLEKGWLKWDDQLTVSPHAAAQPASNLDLYPGQKMTVREAVSALIVKSANDVAVVLAETLAGDEEHFAQIMNQMAESLNMKQTLFMNASGLHAEGQQTTAHDMAIMGLALIKHFPQYYPLFSQQSFEFNGQTYQGHNHVLQEYEGAEGMKTGYVAAVGYNLIATAKKDKTRLLGVVMGYDTIFERDENMKALLDVGFQRVGIQQQAVASGRVNPAFDPLHRRFILPKNDIALVAPKIPYQIKRALTQKIQYVQPQYAPLWTIQVGAFSSAEKAQHMALRAFYLLNQQPVKIQTPETNSLYRAQLAGFSNRSEAVRACEKLNQNNCPCFLVQKRV